MSYEKSANLSDSEISDASVEIEESDSYETSDDRLEKTTKKIKITPSKDTTELKQKEKFKAKKQIRNEKIKNKINRKSSIKKPDIIKPSEEVIVAPVAPVAPVLPIKPKKERKPKIKPIEEIEKQQIYPTEDPIIEQPPIQNYQEPPTVYNPFVAPYRKINYGTNIYGISSNTYAPYFLQLQKNTDRNSRNSRTLYRKPNITDYSIFN
jgi:hypothetical protein